MRRELYRMGRDEAVALLRRAPVVRVASTLEDGTPVLRTVHGVVVDGAVCFHGSPAGEKAEVVGRPAVIAAEEVIAQIPSWFIDAERACPATTYYRSVQVHGVLEAVEDGAAKARVLSALMEKFQPEGRHVPITEEHPLYRAAVKGIAIVRLSLEKLDGKGKLGQNRKPDELARILELLWERGEPGDPRAIDLVRESNPGVPEPSFLAAPVGATLLCGPEDCWLPGAVDLLEGTYWNRGFPRAELERSFRTSTAWVAARSSGGRVIACARLLGDGVKWAGLYDVVVAPDWRGVGLGQAIVRLALAHPAARAAKKVWLRTRDAQALYRKFGFIDRTEEPALPYTASEMLLLR